MIRIKDSIFNENEIKYVIPFTKKELQIMFKNNDDIFVEGTFEDIEWNYGKDTPKFKGFKVKDGEIIADTPKEDKKIEKLDLEDDGNTITLFGEKENEWTILDNVDIIVCNKINEIIDYINKEKQ